MRRRPRLLLSALCATLAASAAVATMVVAAPPAAAATTPALELLSRLQVREQSTAPFDPSLFTFSGEPNTCTAASYALVRDSEVQVTPGLACKITSGRWRSYYEGANPRTYTDASQLGVVQTVPALEAWRSGAEGWSPAQRQNFMDDLTLPAALAVAPLAVVEKRASTDPDAWGPPSSASTCRYAVEWTQVKYRWGLSVDQREHDRLQRWLSTCGGVAVQVPALGSQWQQQTGDPSGDGSPAGSDRLRYGQPLKAGEWLMSPNRTYGLTMQPDGNLVAYGPNRRVLWSADTYGNPGATFHISNDWALEVTSRDGRPLWRTATFAIGGAAELRVQDDGNVVLYRDDKTVAWYTGWDRTGMRGGEDLLPGQRITSANGRYFLTFQADGNIVVYTAGGRPLWFSGTYGAARLTFQPDGNLVAYRGAYPRAVWSTDTWRAGPSRLQVQDDGNVVIYRGDNGRAVWYSGWDTGRWASAPSGGTTRRGDGLA